MAKFIQKLNDFLKRLEKERHTGPVVIRLDYNQGGLRSYRLIREEQEKI